jgi:hypothetical protein
LRISEAVRLMAAAIDSARMVVRVEQGIRSQSSTRDAVAHAAGGSAQLRGNLKVSAELDDNKYPKGVKVCDAQIEALNLSHHSFDGDRCPQPRKILAKGEVDLLIYGHA